MTYTDKRKKLVHLPNIVLDSHEHAEVPQHNVRWIQLMSEVVLEDPWIHEVVSIPVHVHQLDSIRNETRQTRQRVSSHQQSNVGIDGPRRGIKLCVMQSTGYTSGLLAPKAHIYDVSLNGSHGDTY
ncbi:uncharacterized protein TNCV_547971 [Trichonephila clavipes]|nr:uncharacterized protein TNCV_547971 [Trichonephila clavipes]